MSTGDKVAAEGEELPQFGFDHKKSADNRDSKSPPPKKSAKSKKENDGGEEQAEKDQTDTKSLSSDDVVERQDEYNDEDLEFFASKTDDQIADDVTLGNLIFFEMIFRARFQ